MGEHLLLLNIWTFASGSWLLPFICLNFFLLFPWASAPNNIVDELRILYCHDKLGDIPPSPTVDSVPDSVANIVFYIVTPIWGKRGQLSRPHRCTHWKLPSHMTEVVHLLPPPRVPEVIPELVYSIRLFEYGNSSIHSVPLERWTDAIPMCHRGGWLNNINKNYFNNDNK